MSAKNKAPMPEQIIAWRMHPSKVNEDLHGGWAEAEDKREVSYTRTDYAQAMVAAAYEAAAKESRQSCVECGGTGERDTGGTMPWGAPALVSCDCDSRIRALTPTDAKAALDRIVQEAVKEALTVKPLVWIHHPMGQMASTGMGAAYIIDTRDLPRIRWGKWPGGHGPERETLEEMQHAAQADYERRVLAALVSGGSK